MRLTLALVCIAATSCSIDGDAKNEQVTLEYNTQQIRNTATEAGQTAKNLAAGVGNVVGATGRAIKNEVGGVDVDLDVKRTPPQKAEPR